MDEIRSTMHEDGVEKEKLWKRQKKHFFLKKKRNISEKYFCVRYNNCDSSYIWMLVVALELNPGAMTRGTVL